MKLRRNVFVYQSGLRNRSSQDAAVVADIDLQQCREEAIVTFKMILDDSVKHTYVWGDCSVSTPRYGKNKISGFGIIITNTAEGRDFDLTEEFGPIQLSNKGRPQIVDKNPGGNGQFEYTLTIYRTLGNGKPDGTRPLRCDPRIYNR